MQRVFIPSVGILDRIEYPGLPGSSEQVEYRNVAIAFGRGRADRPSRIARAALFAAGLLIGIPLGLFVG